MKAKQGGYRRGMSQYRNIAISALTALALLCCFSPGMGGAVIFACCTFGIALTAGAGKGALESASSRGLLLAGMVCFGLSLYARIHWEDGYSTERWLGVFGYIFVFPAVWAGIAQGRPEAYNAVLRGIRTSVLLGGLWVIGYTTINGLSWDRAILGFVHKNTVGLGFTAAGLVWMHSFRTWKSRIGGVLFLFTVGVCIGSKLSLIVLAVMVLAFWIPPGLVTGLFLCISWTYYIAVSNASSAGTSDTLYQRYLLASEGLRELLQSPTAFWYGFGPGLFISSLKVYQLADITSTHNALLDIWFGFGIVFASAIAVILLWVSARAWRSRHCCSIAFLGFIAHAMFDVGWVRGPGFVAALVMGLALAELGNLDGRFFLEAREPFLYPYAKAKV